MNKVNDDYQLPLTRLYPLADALVMTLKLEKNCKVRGEHTRTVSFPELNGAQFRVPLCVVSSMTDITGEDLGLLLTVSGNLAVFAFYSDFDRGMEMHMIDISKLGDNIQLPDLFERDKVRSKTGALKRLRVGIVASFVREDVETLKWSPLELEETLS